MKESSHPNAHEIRAIAAESIAEIKAIIAELPPRSVEANHLFRLIWRIEITEKAILSGGETLSSEVGRLQAAFVFRKDESTWKPVILTESLLESIDALAEAAEPLLHRQWGDESNA